VVEPPHRLEWRYAEGATGSGGWLLEDAGLGTVRLTLATDYKIKPAWLDGIAHRPFFRGLVEDLLRRSIRRFERYLKDGLVSDQQAIGLRSQARGISKNLWPDA
jgi:uncharacterized membrane protein